MKIYFLSEQVRHKYRRRIVLIGIILGFIVLAVGGGPSILSGLLRVDWTEPDGWVVLVLAILPFPIVGLFVLALLSLIWYPATKQQEIVLESIQVELGEDYVARRQIRVPEVRIRRDEIKYLQETQGALSTFTAVKYRSLSIPRTVEGYEELRATLSSWAPTRPSAQHTRALTIGLTLLVLLGMGITLFSFDLWLVLIAGFGVLGYFGYSYWLLGRQAGVDPRHRLSILFLIVWIIFMTAMKPCSFGLTLSPAPNG